MAERGNPLGATRAKAFDLLAELAAGRVAEIARLETAARVLVAARRAAPAASRHPLAGLARRWDPAAVTAAEFVEHLTPAEVDSVIDGAQSFAAQALAGLSPPEQARAA